MTATANQLPLSTILDVSVSSTPSGVNAFNTSNLALFTSETAGGGFGTNGYKLYLEPNSVATDFGTSSVTYQMALAIFSQTPNILAGGGCLAIIELQTSETLQAALIRTQGLVSYCGILTAAIQSQTDMTNAAGTIQANPKWIGFFPNNASASIAPGGALDLLRTGNYTQSRGLYYGSADTLSALLFAAAYAGRAMSVNFQGSNTVNTMNLKALPTIQPDPTMTPTLYNQAKTAGCDIYASLEGVPGVLSFGANNFFDRVYNLAWLVNTLQVNGFNYLQQTSGKLPQTEEGMDGLKGAYRIACEQARTNGYAAPGTWNSPTTFGNQADLINNIANFGYYIYSSPIASQSATVRVTRAAPVVQLGLKEAGAIHSGSVIVNLNQ